MALALLGPAAHFSSHLIAAERNSAVAAASHLLERFCFECHGSESAEAGINLERMTADRTFATSFKNWQTVTVMLEQGKMPPEDAPQPSEAERGRLISLVRGELQRVIQRDAGDPGHVGLRRLTNAEFRHTIHDLTGLDLLAGTHVVDDAVGGEGFTNVGAVQFMEAATLKRYLELANQVASHAVVGAGPLWFSPYVQEKDGWEMASIARIREIYRAHGFSPGSGEGGEPYGMQRYVDAFYHAWRYRHRQALGLGDISLTELAVDGGVDARFVQHVWNVLHDPSPTYPTAEIIRKWHGLPSPTNSQDDSTGQARQGCRQIDEFLREWYQTLAPATNDPEEIAIMGAEVPEIRVKGSVQTAMRRRPGADLGVLHLSVDVIRPSQALAPREVVDDVVVFWRNPWVRIFRGRRTANRLGGQADQAFAKLLSEASRNQLEFTDCVDGHSDESDNFRTKGQVSLNLDLQVPDDAGGVAFTADVHLDPASNSELIAKCVAWLETPWGNPRKVTLFLGNPSDGLAGAWSGGVKDFQEHLPQVSHREPVPSDRDPIPAPFDNTYGTTDRYDFHYRVRYHRNDRFIVRHILDDSRRRQLDVAWIDLCAAQGHHNIRLKFLAKKFGLNLEGREGAELDDDWIDHCPVEARKYLRDLRNECLAGRAALRAAESGHLQDVFDFADRAWRRPLVDSDRDRLTAYYHRLRGDYELEHAEAVRTVLARVLVSPEFLYRAETPEEGTDTVPLSDRELATRLSYFLWSSMPDAELRKAASARELRSAATLAEQARRMLRDEKSGRLAAEFFGQWFGFYRFDGHTGVDLERFPQFTDELKLDMYEEAVRFFEHIVREDRPVLEVFFADYTFVNAQLAEHYSFATNLKPGKALQRVEQAGRYNRGGVLGLGAVLTTTSAPLRTSPVKRGDWILRRILGTHVPPPPADAGSIPADDVLADGLTVRQRLQAHRRDPKCVNCHSRIDPLGFALERFDAIGRWRDHYRDGASIDDEASTLDGTVISGVGGLRRFLEDREEIVLRTFSQKLLGYALGRGLVATDESLINDMAETLYNGSGRFSDAVFTIVNSRQFQYRRADDTNPKQCSPALVEETK